MNYMGIDHHRQYSHITLARLLRTGDIPEVYKRSRENRGFQRVLRQRAFYVGKQTAVKNRLRALLAQQGEEIRREVLAAIERIPKMAMLVQ